MSETDTASCIQYLIDKDIVIRSISKIKNGKTVRSSGLVSMVESAGEAGGIIMVTDLISWILVEGAVAAEWVHELL